MPVRDPQPARHIEWPDMVYSKNEDLRILHDMKEESEKKRKRKRESSPHLTMTPRNMTAHSSRRGTVTVNTISSVNASFNKKAYLRPVDQGILKDKEGMLNDEVVNWALQVWMNELVGKELNDIYICHAGFWPSIHSDVLKHDKKLVAGDIFRRKVYISKTNYKLCNGYHKIYLLFNGSESIGATKNFEVVMTTAESPHQSGEAAKYELTSDNAAIGAAEQ
ncbi:hypothetical protein BD410DRAFT_800538 [Rickenella mellea]|uniref:Uncharacterized protein n=1 Tax=Rickenella mellea TaxID=50990 RepID=A0A4Y7QGI0_9AGAM|nr:hypothetical protein BD410DRAFT_800538 [Rickenella mellea]